MGQEVGSSRATHKLCSFETPHAGWEAHCILLSVQQLHVTRQDCVPLAGGSRERREGIHWASDSW